MTVASKSPPRLDALADVTVEAPATVEERHPTRRLAIHPGWVVVAAVAAFLVRQSMDAGLNTDVFWHLAAGNWMLSHHAVIRQDVFSYTVHGRPWVAEEWGFEVLLAWLVAHVGTAAYWLLSGAACGAALVVSALRWRRLGAGGLWTAGLSVLVALPLMIGVAPRPQDLSYLLFAVELLVLTAARRRREWLFCLPPLFLIWANVHGSFLAGLAILGLEVILAGVVAARDGGHRQALSLRSGAVSSRLSLGTTLGVRDAALVLVASVLVACANPQGPSLFSYAFHLSTNTQLSANVQEWLPPDFHDPAIFLAIVLPVLLAVAVLATGRVRTDLFDLVLWGGMLALTLHSVRFAPYMGLAFGGLAARWGGSYREQIRPTALSWGLIVVLCSALVLGPHPPGGTPQTTGPLASPVAGAAWLKDQPGRIFSTYAWNDYLISRGRQVFVDGRTDLYFGTDILSTYFDVKVLHRRPDPVLQDWNVRWVLWPAQTALTVYLSQDHRWKLVRHFGNQDVFERVAS